ncbi:hypothetical protein ACLOJK_016681 [Asimina triloba]
MGGGTRSKGDAAATKSEEKFAEPEKVRFPLQAFGWGDFETEKGLFNFEGRKERTSSPKLERAAIGRLRSLPFLSRHSRQTCSRELDTSGHAGGLVNVRFRVQIWAVQIIYTRTCGVHGIRGPDHFSFTEKTPGSLLFPYLGC